MTVDSIIDGETIKLARIAKGLDIKTISQRLGIEPIQVEQIENGGISAFYSETLKLKIAKRLGYMIDLKEDQFLKNNY